MSNVANVSTAKPKIGGAVYSAPLGTTLPTDAVAEINENFKSLGYVSENGIVNTTQRENKEIQAWGGDVVDVPLTKKTDIFKYTLIEAMNTDVLKEVYGENNVTGDINAGITIKANADDLAPHVILVDMILKDGVLKRIVIPNGKVTEVGDISYVDGDPVAYPTTLQAMPDTDGQSHYEYIKKP